MSHAQKLSLVSAILININVMIGAGLFINTVLLAQGAGPASPLVYVLIGLLIFPLIASFSQLLKYHPGGNFYDFAQPIHPYAGFLSLWTYFNTKMAGATLGVHVCVSLLQKIFPLLAPINPLVLDGIIIALFIGLNMLHMHIGKKIQYLFIILKMIPIAFVLIGGLLLFNPAHFAGSWSWSDIAITLPFALYAITGFEAICSLSRKIVDPEKNGPRAILVSFLCVIGLIVAYQSMFYASLGDTLARLASYLEAFPTLTQHLFTSHQVQTFIEIILHSGIAASALGVAYGIIYSNSWNLYSLAQRNLMIAPALFTRLNKYQVPTLALLAEGALAYGYLILTRGYQVPFQQITATGLTITYLLSCAGLLAHVYRTSGRISVTAVGGLMSCALLMLAQIKNFATYGTKYLLVVLCMILIGSAIFLLKRHNLTDFERQKRQ